MAKKDIYIRSAALLAGGMLIAKVIGAIYRIPLTNIVGAEGIGLYQLVFPVYALLITITGSGIPVTVSRLIAEKKIEGNLKGARALFRNSLMLFLIIGAASSVILFLISGFLGRVQGNPDVVNGYRLIAPAIIFSTMISAYRGWFQGNMNMVPSAISQIIEQAVKLSLGLTLAWLFIPKGINYAVWAAIFSIPVSEAVALILLIINYTIRVKKVKQIDLSENFPAFKVNKVFIKELLAVMIPVTLGGLLLPLVQFIDSLLIVNLLRVAGYTPQTATRLYGILSGPVGSLINMPVVLALAFAVSAVPVVSSSRVKRDINSIKAKSRSSVKLSFVIGVPSALALFALSEQVIRVLYPAFDAYELQIASGLLKVSSINILLLSVMQIYTALLQAIDRAYTPFANMVAGGLVKVFLSIFLIQYLGIYGAAISSIAAFSLVVFLNIGAMVRWTGRNQILAKNVSTILLSGVIMGLSLLLVINIKGSSIIKLVIGTIAGVIIYGVMLVLTNTFTREELKGMPLSWLFLKVRDTIRFWEKANDNGSGYGEK